VVLGGRPMMGGWHPALGCLSPGGVRSRPRGRGQARVDSQSAPGRCRIGAFPHPRQAERPLPIDARASCPAGVGVACRLHCLRA
jgi:hypothetical protein